jgi:hypothetical protein
VGGSLARFTINGTGQTALSGQTGTSITDLPAIEIINRCRHGFPSAIGFI